MKWLLALCLLTAAAQAQNPSRGGVINVTVIDTSSIGVTRPFAVMGSVPSTPGSRSMYKGVQFRETVPGHFRIDSLPEDSIAVQVVCPTIAFMSQAGTKAYLHFFVRAGQVIDTTVIVQHMGCDPRPVRNERRVFTGLYTPGFESSEFVPCVKSNWILPSDSLSRPGFRPRAWVTWDAKRKATPVSVVAEAKRDGYGNPTYFVKWRGTMTGPGSYGHLGVSPFEFMVDSILEMSGTVPRDCVAPARR